jgi:exodeoxyribonuclease V beta subunit
MAASALPFEAATIELAGTLLVEASAGTGKTHAITLLVVRLVLEQGLEPSQILVMTFTEAATAELRVRIRRQLHRALEIVTSGARDLAATDPELVKICEKHATAAGLDRLKRALAGLDEASITTIHGFCRRVLQEHALRTGARYGAELVKDLEELDEDIVYDFWHAYVADWPDVIELLPENPLDRLRALLRERRRFSTAPLVPDPAEIESSDARSGALLRFEADFLRYASTELDARKERQGIFGFDDLLERVVNALRGEGCDALTAVLRERFRVALVDEFQDTDPIQWEIVERIFVAGGVPLLLIGDPKQAIYGFRGADVFTYLAAAAGARRATMGVNWRSDPGLVAAVNRFFGAKDAFVFKQIEPTVVVPRPGAKDLFHAPSASGSASVELLLFERDASQKGVTKGVATQRVPRFVAAEIARLLGEGATIDGKAVRAGDIAVLTRDNKQCFLMQDALRARGVHSVVLSDKSVWTSEEAVDLENLLRGVLDPGSSSARKVALSTTIVGKSGEWIDDLDRRPELLEEWLERFGHWGALWVERGFLRMFREILRELSVPDRLLSQQGGERRLTNALHLAELLERAREERQLGPAALLEWLREQQRDDSNRGEHTEIRLESDTNAVKILTVHKSKGLEFPIVYCPFLWSSGPWRGPAKPEIFHDEDGKAFLDIDLDKDRRAEHMRAAERERIADEIRLAYVALTRAKHRLCILWGCVNRFGIAAMSFILHPDPAILWNNALTAARLDKLTDRDLASVLEGFAEGSDGSIAFRRIAWRHDAPALPRPTGDPKLLVAREIERSIRGFARTESFSGLTRGAHEALVHGTPDDDAVSRDHDEQAQEDAVLHADELSASVEASNVPGAAPDVSFTLPSLSSDTPIVLGDFPRGSRAGNFFHEIFENIDFAASEPADWLEVVTENFEKHGFSREFQGTSHDLLLGQAMNAVRDTLETTLDATGLRLADIEREQRFNELEFRVPVAPGSAPRQLSVRRLAAVFAGHPSAAVPAAYAERVERLRFASLYGYLKGYIDLVFFHEGRWYVVDYKTNHLGDRLGDYDQPRMQRAMADSHYYLQYHLYTLAVDRFLRRVEARYDYESGFGGVFYLFIKGLCPGHKTGIFFEKPPRARLDALSTLLDGGAP